MIRLHEWLTPEVRDLHYSLEQVDIHEMTIVLNDDGCLPDGVTSPYSFFCEMEAGDTQAIYFNQLIIPEFWQITGTNTQGEIWDLHVKKANIYYHQPKHLRLVKDVDWLDDQQRVYRTDHYNQYGWVYAKTYFNEEGKIVHKKYYTKCGKEVIVENAENQSVFLYWQDKVYLFEKRTDFFLFYLKQSGLDTSTIWYTTLSTPFILTYYLGGEGEDILFWQEKIVDHIPGNMQLILSGAAKRTKKIIVQDKKTYNNMLNLLPEEQHVMIHYLGYLYPSKKENRNQKEILILTNSDQLEGLDILLSQLSDYHFHIAALTEMSQRLMAYETYSQVTLYPNVSVSQVEKLFNHCDIYLDINHGSEILSAIRQAFEYNLVIAGFQNTIHHAQLMLNEAIFSADQPILLAKWLLDQSDLSQTIQQQRDESGQECPTRYLDILNRR